MGNTKKITISIKQNVLENLKKQAQEQNMTVSGYITYLITKSANKGK